MVGNYRRIAGMRALMNPWGAGDTRELATLLTNPLKGFDVQGLRLDVDVFVGQEETVPSNVTPNPFYAPDVSTFQWGFLVMTQREDTNGIPAGGEFPNMAISQWPVNVDADEFEITEDQDYATRIHYQKSGFLRPNQVVTVGDIDGPHWPPLPGRPHTHFSCRVPIRRRIPDGYGLYLGFWTLTPPTWELSNVATAEFSCSGDLWYRLAK